MSRFVAILCLVLLGLTASAAEPQQEDYARTAAKAQRFFDQGEWLNANAMYLLMLNERPAVTETYAHAVVTNVMLADTAAVTRLFEESMQHNISFDTLLGNVQTLSTNIGISDLYERLLLTLRNHFTWMQRGLNVYLLRYYDFRDNGPEMVRYAALMLQGKPGDVEFMRIQARGYMLQGMFADAQHVWTEILRDHPDNYDTLLDLGNYLYTSGKKAEARPYLQRAYDLRPTPYVAKLLTQF